MKSTDLFFFDLVSALAWKANRSLRFQASRLSCFWMGMREFRSDAGMTWDNDPSHPFSESYDWGREWAHRLTLRAFDC